MLTGMLNRRALDQRLHELTARARITGQPIAVIAGDIDNWNSVNDEHGRATATPCWWRLPTGCARRCGH